MEYLEERYPEPDAAAVRPCRPSTDPAAHLSLRPQPRRCVLLAPPRRGARSRRGDVGFIERLRPPSGRGIHARRHRLTFPGRRGARDMLGFDLSEFPAIESWLAQLLQRPAVAAEANVIAAPPRCSLPPRRARGPRPGGRGTGVARPGRVLRGRRLCQRAPRAERRRVALARRPRGRIVGAVVAVPIGLGADRCASLSRARTLAYARGAPRHRAPNWDGADRRRQRLAGVPGLPAPAAFAPGGGRLGSYYVALALLLSVLVLAAESAVPNRLCLGRDPQSARTAPSISASRRRGTRRSAFVCSGAVTAIGAPSTLTRCASSTRTSSSDKPVASPARDGDVPRARSRFSGRCAARSSFYLGSERSSSQRCHAFTSSPTPGAGGHHARPARRFAGLARRT